MDIGYRYIVHNVVIHWYDHSQARVRNANDGMGGDNFELILAFIWVCYANSSLRISNSTFSPDINNPAVSYTHHPTKAKESHR